MMNITVSGRHMELDEDLRDYAVEKTSKLERYYDRVQTVDVVFDREANNHAFRCEVIAKADHHTTFVAKESHDDPYAALDLSTKELERQLRRHKEKFRNRKHPDGLVDKTPLGGSPAEPSAEG